MRRLLLSLLLTLTALPLLAQWERILTIRNPEVGRQQKSEIGTASIERIDLSSRQVVAYFSYTPSRSGSETYVAISLAQSTTLTCKTDDGKQNVQATEWGSIDGFGFNQRLLFNERYNLRQGSRYSFYIIFPLDARTATRLSINEDKHKGFYWEKIVINNHQQDSHAKASKRKKQDGKKSSKKESTSKKQHGKKNKKADQEATPSPQEQSPKQKKNPRIGESDGQGGVWV